MNKNLIVVLAAVIVIGGAVVVFRQMQTTRVSPSVQVEVSPATVEVSPQVTQTTTKTSLVTGITLTVSSPANNVTVTSPTITVRGKTVAGAEVFVNDTDTNADAGGNFSVTLTLDEGDNYILVVANDSVGNYSEKELSVTYTP